MSCAADANLAKLEEQLTNVLTWLPQATSHHQATKPPSHQATKPLPCHVPRTRTLPS